MDEAGTANPQFARGLREVHADRVAFGVDERIETENEIDAAVRHHVERRAVVDDIFDVCVAGEPFAARRDASLRQVDEDQLAAEVPQEMAPASETWTDFEHGSARYESLDPRKDRARPEYRRFPPASGPATTHRPAGPICGAASDLDSPIPSARESRKQTVSRLLPELYSAGMRIPLSTVALILLLCVTPSIAGGHRRNGLPTPESVFGFRPGADYKLATYDQSVDYFKKIAAASKYMKLVEAGKTSAGAHRCTSRWCRRRRTSRKSIAIARSRGGWRIPQGLTDAEAASSRAKARRSCTSTAACTRPKSPARSTRRCSPTTSSAAPTSPTSRRCSTTSS